MAFDFEKFKQSAANAVGSTAKRLRQYTPESFSKEKKFVNAIVSTLALMVMADKKVETEEVEASMEFIQSIQEIIDLEMQVEAIELFELHVENLSKVMDNPVKWIIASTKLIADIAKVKDYSAYVVALEALMDHIAGSDGSLDPSETEMKRKILSALK